MNEGNNKLLMQNQEKEKIEMQQNFQGDIDNMLKIKE